LKIGCLTQNYPGLSHTFIQREVLALRELGVDVYTYSIRSPGACDLLSDDNRRENESTQYVLPPKWAPLMCAHFREFFSRPLRYFRTLALALRVRPGGLRGVLWAMFYFAEAIYLAALWKRDSIEHAHIHFAMSCATPGMLASYASGIPYSVTIHGPSVFLKAREYRVDEKVKRASFAVCISEFCRNKVASLCGSKDRNKLHVIHCGVNPETYSPPRVVYGRNSQLPTPNSQLPIHLLSVGRLAHCKGFHILLEAIAHLKSKGVPVKLNLIGDGPERALLENHAGELGIGDCVTFEGGVGQDDIQAYYDACDIFVLPSFDEGVPVVLMEAMAKEIPVVTTRITGVPELVEDGVSGVLVNPGNAEELANAVAHLAEDAELRKIFGKAGREKVLDEFDSRKNARSLKILFERYITTDDK